MAYQRSRPWMQTLARVRARVARLREGDGGAGEALDLAARALAITDELRTECAALQQRCTALEADLRVRQEKTRLLFDVAPIAMLTTDASGTIVDSNRAGAALLGRSAPRLCDELLMHFFDDRAAFAELVRELPDVTTPVRRVLRLRPRERAPLDAEITLVPDPRSTERRWVWFLTVISGPRPAARVSAQAGSAAPLAIRA